jgi:copper transport protein
MAYLLRITGRFTAVLLPVIMMALWIVPAGVSAHASLVQALPGANDKLMEAPKQVSLQFNEMLDSGYYQLAVLDSGGTPVAASAPSMSEDRRQLTLELPALAEGIYTVTYRVISADGHPVAGSYVFTVGDPPPAKDASSFDLHRQMGHGNHAAHSFSSGLSLAQVLLFASRIAYYAALLAVAGWFLWSMALRLHGGSPDGWIRGWGTQLMRVHLLALLALILTHGYELLNNIASLEEWGQLLTRTGIGRMWIVSLVLSAIGFVLLLRNRWLDGLWSLALLGAKSASGHAAATETQGLAILLDWVHLLAASLWAGGLLLLFVLRARNREQFGRFAPVFSNAALASIAVMVITGVLNLFLFLPRLHYLLYTTWGILLIVKTGFVLAVIVVGALLRRRIRRGAFDRSRALFRLDLTLLGSIVAVVGILSYASPLPANEPLYWHRMGDDLHLTVSISPNSTGTNQYIVKVWLPEALGEPKRVALRLHPLDREEVAPIEVPLEAYDDTEPDLFDGFGKYTYRAQGTYMPFPGRWEAEVRVLDSEDTEHVHRIETRIY